ncbi:hypothetical protein SBV1_1450029 [Verrucomicrobia bacterium]|nr:hypothetical protein SBV1_1450029 [Verrucomicrobiota bacterium]
MNGTIEVRSGWLGFRASLAFGRERVIRIPPKAPCKSVAVLQKLPEEVLSDLYAIEPFPDLLLKPLNPKYDSPRRPSKIT